MAITLDRYGHLNPGDIATYVDRLGVVALDPATACCESRRLRVPDKVSTIGCL